MNDSPNPKGAIGDTAVTEEAVIMWVQSMDDAVSFIQLVISGQYETPNSDVVRPYSEHLKAMLQKDFIISRNLDKSIYEQAIADAASYLQS